jgi:hypothetical protein
MYRLDTSPRYVPIECNASPGRAQARNGRGAGQAPAEISGLGTGGLPSYPVGHGDYALARRATLKSVLTGRTTIADVCDAHPYLLRAAKFHGEPTDRICPICRAARLTHVTYVYGDELGQYEGRVKKGPELDEMALEYGEFQAYVVEVCQSCAWNHLASSYVLGTGEPRTRRGRRVRASD